MTVSSPMKPLNVPTVTAPAVAEALYCLLAIVGAVTQSGLAMIVPSTDCVARL